MTVVLVTGGSGLLGQAIRHVIETEPANSKFAKQPDETWIFASSADGDLRFDWHRIPEFVHCIVEIPYKLQRFLTSINLLMSSISLPSVSPDLKRPLLLS